MDLFEVGAGRTDRRPEVPGEVGASLVNPGAGERGVLRPGAELGRRLFVGAALEYSETESNRRQGKAFSDRMSQGEIVAQGAV